VAKKKAKTYRIVGEPIVDKTIEDVSERVCELAEELRRATDALHRRQLTNSIMHLAADIAVTVAD
jgi:hypothetical protein